MNMLLQISSFSLFHNENILSACLGFCFAIEIDIAFLNSNFKSVPGLLLEHSITLFCLSLCISFVKIFAKTYGFW